MAKRECPSLVSLDMAKMVLDAIYKYKFTLKDLNLKLFAERAFGQAVFSFCSSIAFRIRSAIAL